jgi:hypothetical protein
MGTAISKICAWLNQREPEKRQEEQQSVDLPPWQEATPSTMQNDVRVPWTAAGHR